MTGAEDHLRDCELRLLATPLPEGERLALHALLGHKGEPWLTDILWRMENADGDSFAVAFRGEEAVASVWLGRSLGCPEVGLLGHVFTAPEHRRRGLAGRLLELVLEGFDRSGGRWVRLTTGNAAAARLYERTGFGMVLGGAKEEHLTMLRPADPAGLRARLSAPPSAWNAQLLCRLHYPSACLLLAARDEGDKLPACGIDRGLEAERRLLEVLGAHDSGRQLLWAMVEEDGGSVRALACVAGTKTEVYAPALDASRAQDFARAVDALRKPGR